MADTNQRHPSSYGQSYPPDGTPAVIADKRSEMQRALDIRNLPDPVPDTPQTVTADVICPECKRDADEHTVVYGDGCLLTRCDVYRLACGRLTAALGSAEFDRDRAKCDAQGFLDTIMQDTLQMQELRVQLATAQEERDRAREDNAHLRAEKAIFWAEQS
ncbi:MAG: hypothetical protein WC700_02215 [Gemmatimonadaceae bacterium]|jgi:hypothetical protein